MSTLLEIEKAVPQLGESELSHLEQFVRSLRFRRAHKKQQSAFDLPPLRLGEVLQPLSVEDDLLEEMLNDPRN